MKYAEETVSLINREEAYFGLDQTPYPQLQPLKDTVEPYEKLFTLILQWQRTETKWLDGLLQEQNSDTIDDDFGAERAIFKLQKLFLQREKKEEQQQQESTAEPPKEFELKVESPTVAMCTTILTQIRALTVLQLVPVGRAAPRASFTVPDLGMSFCVRRPRRPSWSACAIRRYECDT